MCVYVYTFVCLAKFLIPSSNPPPYGLENSIKKIISVWEKNNQDIAKGLRNFFKVEFQEYINFVAFFFISFHFYFFLFFYFINLYLYLPTTYLTTIIHHEYLHDCSSKRMIPRDTAAYSTTTTTTTTRCRRRRRRRSHHRIYLPYYKCSTGREGSRIIIWKKK